MNTNQQRHRDDLGAGQPLTVKRLWMANTADEIQAILMEYAKSLLDENASLRARIAELEATAITEPTTVLEWLQQLPDGYRERAIGQYNHEFAKSSCSRYGQPKEITDAIEGFAIWETTNEGEDFWRAVYHHYKLNEPLPPLPI
jgi:hypothetical protein